MERPKRKPTAKAKAGLNSKKDISKEFDFKKAEADDEVMQALFEMAKSGKNTTAAIFWAKTRCGMREEPRKKERPASQAPTIVIRSEEKQA
jgi:hypothetical protein